MAANLSAEAVTMPGTNFLEKIHAPDRKFYVIFNSIIKVATELFCLDQTCTNNSISGSNNSCMKALCISNYVPRLKNSLNIAG